jgi:hypothetical protein
MAVVELFSVLPGEGVACYEAYKCRVRESGELSFVLVPVMLVWPGSHASCPDGCDVKGMVCLSIGGFSQGCFEGHC